jgi:hypothetical protein
LITAVARTVEPRGGRPPVFSEPVRGELTVRNLAGRKLYALGRDGRKSEAGGDLDDGGTYRIALPAASGTHWFILE